MPSKSSTRSHGEGSIYRSDYTRPATGVTVERWIASVDLGVGANGKRLRKKITGPSRKAVADKLRKLQREQDAGVDVRKKSMTVADLAHEWLSHLERNEGTKEEGTILRLRPRVERHIVPAGRIGGRQLDQLTVAQIEAWLRVEAESGGKGGKPQARVTCRDYKQMLGEMLEWAVARRYITWNPARLAKLPKDRSATNPDAPADLQQIAGEGIVHPRAVHEVDGCADRDRRRRLHDSDPKRLLHRDAQHRRAARRSRCPAMGAGRPQAPHDHRRPRHQTRRRWTPTEHRADQVRQPTRNVEMTDVLVAALRRRRKQQAEDRLGVGNHWTTDLRWADLVFTSEVGTPIDPSHARRDFKKICAHAGVPALSLYEMRHTVASLMVDADVPLREVADLLGHKDLEMVVKRYRHRTDGVVKSHVAVLGSLSAQEN